MDNNSLVVSDDFKQKLNDFKQDFYNKMKEISHTETPTVDGEGKKIVNKRPDGLDYIIEAYMKDRMNFYFPGWSWEHTSPMQLLGSEWIISEGQLVVVDEHLAMLGINPPVRKFKAGGAARIMFKKGLAHIPENVVDVDKNVKAANTNAFKKAINQLTGIGDDVYGKRIEDEGAGSYEDVLVAHPGQSTFLVWAKNKYPSLLISKIKEILGTQDLATITDWETAKAKIEEAMK